MDSKKLELEQRLSALNGFTESEDFVYRSTLATIFNDVKSNVYLMKELLRYYYKNTKVVTCKKSKFYSFNKDTKKHEKIKEEKFRYEITPKFKYVIDLAIDSVVRKVYKLFIEKLDYFLENGKIKLTEYGDYEHDPDDYEPDPDDSDEEREHDADDDSDEERENDADEEREHDTDEESEEIWENSKDGFFSYEFKGFGFFTKDHVYEREVYPVNVYNYLYKDFNEKDNTAFVEKCKLYSDSLEKFKNELCEELKKNLSIFKYDTNLKIFFKNILKFESINNNHDVSSIREKKEEGYDDYYDDKGIIDEEYDGKCELNFAVPYLTEINKDVIEKRKEIQAEIDALN